MVSEEISQQFDVIEDKVEKLIEVCKSLEATNSELEIRMKELEKELQEKNEEERQHVKQRDLVRGKIDGLLAKLNNFTEIESLSEEKV